MSETMHGLRYKWLIGDGDSSVYNAVSQGVLSYGLRIVKVKCDQMLQKQNERSL